MESLILATKDMEYYKKIFIISVYAKSTSYTCNIYNSIKTTLVSLSLHGKRNVDLQFI